MEPTAQATSFTDSHPLQTDAWASFRKAMGIDTEMVDGMQVTFHHIPSTPWTIGYVPKGPLPTQQMIDQLTTLGKKKNAVFIQLEPNVEQTEGFRLPIIKSLVPSHHPLFTKYTFVLDLTKPEEELLKAMHPKTRYNIRVAEKHKVIVKEDNSTEAFAEYQRLEEETTGRQRFYAHNRRYHEIMWDTMHKANIAHLWTATYKGEVIAAWIIFVHGNTMYYPYGASSRNHREVMAPNLLLWELVKWGKKQHLKAFDLWGAMGPNPDTNDAWYGFHRFKEGYRPTLVEFIGSYDLVLKPFLYKIYCFADMVRWTVLKLFK